METSTASIERSLQICSLNHTAAAGSSGIVTAASTTTAAAVAISSSYHAPADLPSLTNISDSNSDSDSDSSSCSDPALIEVELNSHLPLPYPLEQCLDLKTGELYYINRKTGMRTKQDPRLSYGNIIKSGCFYWGEDDVLDNESDYCSECMDEDDELEDDSGDISDFKYMDDNSSEWLLTGDFFSTTSSTVELNDRSSRISSSCGMLKREDMLVVAGCKSCLVYSMLPRHVQDCPKCAGQLLHFD